jgi:hypothetical protein
VFAVFEDERVTLYRIPYDIDRAAGRIDRLPVEATVRRHLVHLVREGRPLEDVSPIG